MEDSLDEIRAKNSSLRFLCKINADWREVERFLIRYPEALLFEGVDNDRGVQSVVEVQMSRCKCFVSVCNANRKQVLILLKRGFEYYRGVVFNHSLEEDWFLRKVASGTDWTFYADQLKVLERDLRDINDRKIRSKNQIEKARAEVKQCRQQLEYASRKESHGRTTLALLKCQRNTEQFERRSQLENKLGGATLNIASLEKEQDLLVQETILAERLQRALLKSAFAGCERHVCDATRSDYE